MNLAKTSLIAGIFLAATQLEGCAAGGAAAGAALCNGQNPLITAGCAGLGAYVGSEAERQQRQNQGGNYYPHQPRPRYPRGGYYPY